MQHTRARKRMTRREIKESKLLIWTSRMSMYLEDHLWLIIAGVAVVVVLIVGIYIYRGWHARQTARGMEQLNEVAYLVRVGNYAQAIQRADQLTSRFVGEPDRMARLYKADALRDSGMYVEAGKLYENWLRHAPRGDEVDSYHAARGFADCLGAQAQEQKAGGVLRAWADGHKKSGLAPHALIGAATHFEAAGDYAAARDALQRVIDEYPDALVTGAARQRLKLMEGAVAASK